MLSDETCNIAFFDLDDTLIPTEWVRHAFVTARDLKYSNSLFKCTKFSPSNEAESKLLSSKVSVEDGMNLDIQNSVRAELERLGGKDFDEVAANLIESACRQFAVVVVVTNARRSSWLRIASALFPRLKSKLMQFSVPIIRATSASNRSRFLDAGEYFQYWSNLKKIQFERVASITLKVIKLLNQNPSGLTPKVFSSYKPEPSLETCAKTLDRVATSHTDFQLKFLLSPRTNNDIETLLQKKNDWVVQLDTYTLVRVIAHQLKKFLIQKQINKRTDGDTYKETDIETNNHDASSANVSSKQDLFVNNFLKDNSKPIGLDQVTHDQQKQVEENEKIPSKAEQLLKELKINIICVGDSEFELCAAKELAISLSSLCQDCGLIKCKTGLPPDKFTEQIKSIHDALDFFVTETWKSKNTRSKAQKFGLNVICEITSFRCLFKTLYIGQCLQTRKRGRQIKDSEKLTHLDETSILDKNIFSFHSLE